MNAASTINVLIVTQQLPAGDMLINALRRAGYSIHAEAVQDEYSLRDRLSMRRWDFLCYFSNEEHIQPKALSRALTELQVDVCCLVIGSTDLPALLSANIPRARLVAGLDSLNIDQQASLLTRVVDQELQNLADRRDLRRTTAHLHELETRYQALLDSSSDAVAYLHEGLHIYANGAYLALLGLNIENIANKSLLDFVAQDSVAEVREFLQQHDKDSKQTCAFELTPPHRAPLRVSLECSAVQFNGESALQATIRPMLGNLPYQSTARDLLNRDLVTGLLNENGIVAEIEKAIAEAVHGDCHSVLTVLRLTGFDELMTLAGRSATNLFLVDIARSIEQLLPGHNQIGRIGPNLYAVLSLDAESFKPVENILHQLQQSMLKLAPAQADLAMEIGSCAVNELSLDGTSVIERAKHNLDYNTLANGGPESPQDESAQVLFERLEQAIDNDDFMLVFQPIVNLQEDGVERYEIRIRLRDKDNLIYPPSFLETANQAGLGEKIDQWVISKSLELLQNKEHPSLQLTVNLTHNSIVSPNFLPWLSEALHSSRISAEKLVLQVSELDIVSFTEQAKIFFHNLRELGIRLSITHFGCTLRPFEYLPGEDAKFVKLDRALLSDIEIDQEKREALSSTVKALQNHNIEVIAPMIDKIDLLPLLWQAGLNYVQGNSLQEPSDRMNYSFIQEEEITLSAF
ncbi:MAG: EAL domain-containing protein [Pseudohongiellaceae bacterium]|nr:EAL domain-containing protein [Pseudohongiellaceae bacterium]